MNFTPGCSETFCLTPNSERTDPGGAEAGCFSLASLFPQSQHRGNNRSRNRGLQTRLVCNSKMFCFSKPSGSTLAGRPSLSINGSGWWKCLAFLCEPLSDRLAAAGHTAAPRATVTHGNTTPNTTTVYSACINTLYTFTLFIWGKLIWDSKQTINILRSFIYNQAILSHYQKRY